MKIGVVGAGSIGGYVGALLALAGEEVTFLVRGAHLAAIREHGFHVEGADGSERRAYPVHATSDYAQAGVQDLVILAVKAHQLEDVCPQLEHLLDAQTPIVMMQNGIPHWYFHRHGGTLEGTSLRSVDPQQRIERAIPARRVIGCVVYPATDLVAPGRVRHVEGNRFALGELDGTRSLRIERIAAAFERAGFQAPVLEDIRSEIWLKLWGNCTFNPISCLTQATLAGICRQPLGRDLAADMMREAQAVAHKLGIVFRVPLERRIAGAQRVGEHKTSMLQDVEARRATEIDALVGSVSELGRLTGTPTPRIDTAYALVKLLDATLRQQQTSHLPVAA